MVRWFGWRQKSGGNVVVSTIALTVKVTEIAGITRQKTVLAVAHALYDVTVTYEY